MKHLTLPLLLVCRQQPWRTGHFSISRRLLNKRAVAYCCYDRHSDSMQEIGTFHGDDLAGLIEKGAGVQQSQQTADYYAFSRQYQGDKALVVWVGDQKE